MIKAEAAITQETTRIFDIKQDAYGVVVTDRDTGIFVILDWNGKKITGVIGQGDENHRTEIYDPQNTGDKQVNTLTFYTPEERARLEEKRRIEADTTIDREPVDREAIARDYAARIREANSIPCLIGSVPAFWWDESDDL